MTSELISRRDDATVGAAIRAFVMRREGHS